MTATPQNTTPQTITDERRVAPRRRPALGTICRLETGEAASVVALVWNISTTGISMLLSAPRPIGSSISGYLELTDGDDMLRIQLTVLHLKKLETGDFYIGGRFDKPLKAEELKPFVVEE